MHFEELWDLPIDDLKAPTALHFLLRLDAWTWEDALAILLYVNPKAETYGSGIERLDGVDVAPIEPDGKVYEYALDELSQIWRSGSHKAVNPPAYYIEWASAKGIPIRWKEWATKNGLLKPSSAENSDRPLSIREKDSTLKLIVGMAVGGYGYDIAAHRSDAPKRIADDCEKLGLNITDDTVRKYLEAARKLVPRGSK